MANKGLIIGVVALLAVGGLFVVLKPKTEAPAPQQEMTAEAPAPETAPAVTEETQPATETATTEEATPDTPAPVTEEAPAADTAATEEAPAAATGEGSLLAAPQGMEVDVKKAMEDRSLGDINAPVTIIEYASMTCPHCAHFHKTILPQVKEKLIDTGKVLFIFRDFPLDGTATKAAMMARCADQDKYFNLIEVIFGNQERWIKAEDPLKALAQLGTLAGMDESYINMCINNAELENDMLGRINEAQTRYSIKQTPTFVFNGGEESFSGAQPIEKFEEVVKKLSAGK